MSHLTRLALKQLFFKDQGSLTAPTFSMSIAKIALLGHKARWT